MRREADIAPGRHFDRADGSGRQRIDGAGAAGARVEQLQSADPGLVHHIGDEAPVGRDAESVDVPPRVGRDGAERAGSGIDCAEALIFGTFVGGHPERAVRREDGAAIGDVAGCVADRGQAAALEIEQVEIRIGDLLIVDDDGAAAVMGEIHDVPAAALDLRHHPVGRAVARVDDIEVGVGAVAAGRAVADQAAIMAPGAEIVSAAAVGEKLQPPVGEGVELVEFVAANVLLRDQHVARRGPGSGDRLFLEAQLLAIAERRGDPVELGGVAEARGDQHRSVAVVPAGEARRCGTPCRDASPPPARPGPAGCRRRPERRAWPPPPAFRALAQRQRPSAGRAAGRAAGDAYLLPFSVPYD